MYLFRAAQYESIPLFEGESVSRTISQSSEEVRLSNSASFGTAAAIADNPLRPQA